MVICKFCGQEAFIPCAPTCKECVKDMKGLKPVAETKRV